MAIQCVVQNTFLHLTTDEVNVGRTKRSRSEEAGSRKAHAERQTLQHLEELWCRAASLPCRRGFEEYHDVQVMQSETSFVCKGTKTRSLGQVGHISSLSSVSTMATLCSDGSGLLKLGSSTSLSSMSSTSLSSMSWCDENELSDDSTCSAQGVWPTVCDTAGHAAVALAPRESKHGSVPKHVNLAERFAEAKREGKAVTTVMIRNIPNRCSQRELINQLEMAGFANCFDFVYVPLDLGTMSNVGYAFVNFIDAAYASQCMDVLPRHTFGRLHRSGKPIAVSAAHMQGLTANLEHYEKSAVNKSRLRQRRPVVMNILKTVSLASLV